MTTERHDGISILNTSLVPGVQKTSEVGKYLFFKRKDFFQMKIKIQSPQVPPFSTLLDSRGTYGKGKKTIVVGLKRKSLESTASRVRDT